MILSFLQDILTVMGIQSRSKSQQCNLLYQIRLKIIVLCLALLQAEEQSRISTLKAV